MRKLAFLTLLLFSVNTYSQVLPQISDTLLIETDTLKIMEIETGDPKKSSFGQRIGKFLGIDNDKIINDMKETISQQNVMIDSLSNMVMEPRTIIKTVPNLSPEAAKSIKKDEKFIKDLPKTYDGLSKEEISKITSEIDDKIGELLRQRDSLISTKSNQELIDAKSNVIKSLQREKQVIKLSEESDDLKGENSVLNDENEGLKIHEAQLRRYLYISFGALFVLGLIIAIYFQRKTIKGQDVEIENQLRDINKKNTYLEHAAKIIRHDMHSGINTYMPRGINSLEKTLTEEEAKKLKIYNAIRMIKEGLTHTQKVYKSVYEFTNLVKQNVVIDKKESDLKDILSKYISNTSYSSQVEIEELVKADVNETLFCNAIDNLIKNGLKYNDSENKLVKIYMEDNDLIVQDNGRGMTQKKFENICFSYLKKNDKNPNDDSTGLGLNICLAILNEHGFDMTCEKNKIGTKIKIKIKK